MPIWDTACPPILDHCRFQTPLRPHWQRFRIIHLETISGITLFFSHSGLYGIYPHELPGSCAISMYESFPERRRQSLVWIYLPISRSDRILVFGTRAATDGGLCILVCTTVLFKNNQFTNTFQVRTEQSGDIILGPAISSPKPDCYLIRHKSAALIVSEPSADVPITLGAYNTTTHMSTSENPKPFDCPIYTRQNLHTVNYLSSAPLAQISNVYVFEDDTKSCRGILFEYIGGGSRAVGQCRIGVDLCVKYVRPSTICHRASCLRQQVAFNSCSTTHEHIQKSWDCRPLCDTRILHFWFSLRSSRLSLL